MPKKTKPIISGDIIFAKKIPNLNHNLFKGVKNWELINPKNKKIREVAIDHNLILSLFKKGYKPINRKTIKKTIPKLLLEFTFLSFMSEQTYINNSLNWIKILNLFINKIKLIV